MRGLLLTSFYCSPGGHQNRTVISSTCRRSVLLRSKRRLSDVDVERARLLHQYPLHRASADAQRIAYLQYARAALAATRVGRLRSKSSPGGRAAELPSGSSQLLNCLDWPNVHRLAPFTPDQHRTRKSCAIGNNATARRPFDTPSPCRCRTLRF